MNNYTMPSPFSFLSRLFVLRENEGGGGGGEQTVEAPWTGDDVWKIGEGDNAQPWHALFPDEAARQHVEKKGFKNPAELALSNYNLTKLQSGDPTVIGLPGADATPEQMQEFYSKIGRPDAPDGYEFKFGEGVKVDDSLVTFAKSAFHEAGLTPTQAQFVADKWNEFASTANTQTVDQQREQNDQAMDALKTEWGADLDKNKAAGQRVVKALGLSSELVDKVEASIGSAAVVELLAKIGRKSDEGGFLTTDNGDPNDPANLSKEGAAAKIKELEGDQEFQKKYFDKNHPGHKDALKLMEQLYARS